MSKIYNTVYFQLMAAGNRMATVSVRPIAAVEEGYQPPTWAYEVRYTGKAPERGMITVPSDIEELYLVSRVLQDYFATHPRDIVPS